MTDYATPHEKQIHTLGRTLIGRFFVLLKTAQYYSGGHHEALATPARFFLAPVQNLHKARVEAVIRHKAGSLFLGELRLKADAHGFDAFKFTLAILQSYFIKSITFLPGITDLEIRRLTSVFTDIPPVPTPETFTKFRERLAECVIRHVELESMGEELELLVPDESVTADLKRRARQIYSRALREVALISSLAVAGKHAPLVRSKRIVQNMVDQLMGDEIHLLTRTTVKSTTSFTEHHSVNVAILSLMIGRRIGLPNNRLCDLGVAALHHDMGKQLLPRELLDQDTDFNEEEEALFRQHPLLGAKLLMEIKPLDALTAAMIAANLEHHLKHDHSGYPSLRWERQHLFSRIIALADDYDSLTSSRVFPREPLPPDMVISWMLSPYCTAYDPILLKLFVNAVGMYPVGSLLLLDSRELAVTVRNNPDPARWMLPTVRIVAYPTGEERGGEIINLADADAGRAIVKAMNPCPYHIDVAGYVI